MPGETEVTFAEANTVLRQAGVYVRRYKLENKSGALVISRPGNSEVILDGEFTADQLEAIAMWMRNSAEVTNA